MPVAALAGLLPEIPPMKSIARIFIVVCAAILVGCTNSQSSDDIHARSNNAGGYNMGMAPPMQPTTSRGEGNSRVQGQIY
jgi:hypothetical protein